MPKDPKPELPIIQHTYDFILSAIPVLNRWPRDPKHLLGDRIAGGLYGFLEGLVAARYTKDKADRLQNLNGNPKARPGPLNHFLNLRSRPL